MLNDYKPFILIVSGPSGSGKSTIVSKFLKLNKDFQLSVSHTTRRKRVGEVDGKNYYFISKEKFQEMIKKDEFIEWANIYGNYYGTSKVEIENILKAGKNVLLEINVDGLVSAKRIFNEEIVSVFIIPETIEELIKRLKERNSESDEDLKKRILEVEREISYINLYDYGIINKRGNLKESVNALICVIEAEKRKIKRSINIKEKFFRGL